MACVVAATIWYLTRDSRIATRPTASSGTHSQENTLHDAGVRQLGLVVQPLSTVVMDKHKLGNSQGVIVSEVIPNTPGTEAGLRVGDVILVLGNHPVTSVADLDQAVSVLKPGTRKPIEVVRDGFRMTLHLKFNGSRGATVSP